MEVAISGSTEFFPMRRILICSVLAFCLYGSLIAQENAPWTLQGHIGSLHYLGDLSYQGYAKRTPSFSVGAARPISPSVDVQFQLLIGTMYGNDRSPNSKVQQLNSHANFSRSLNFRSRIRDLSIQAVYHFDNGRILSTDTRISPYVTAGIGLTNFQVSGDLYNGAAQNQPYHYWQDGSIRSRDEGEQDAGSAVILEQDGIYDTNLTNMGTEAEGTYPTTVLHIPVGLGVKFKVSSRIAIVAQVDTRFVFSDYLDDVSGTYKTVYSDEAVAYAANPSEVNQSSRGNPNLKRDRYWNPLIGLHVRLGKSDQASQSLVNKTGRDPDGLSTVNNTKRINYPDGSAEEVEVVPFDVIPGSSPPLGESNVVKRETIASTDGKDTVFIYRTDTIYANGSTPDTVYKYVVPPGNNRPSNTGNTGATSKEALESLYTKLLALNQEMVALRKRNEKLDELTKKGGPGGNTNIRPPDELRSIFPKLKKEVIYYGFGEYEVSTPQQERLRAIVELMEDNPSIGLLISGHADPVGDPNVNLYISRLRAEAASKYMNAAGIDPSRIMTRFYGEAVPTSFTGAPVIDNDAERRVEVDFIKVK